MASDADTLPASTSRTTSTTTHHGRYQVRGVLGSGGMGIVLDAFDPVLDRPVALKLLHPEVSRGSGARGAADRLTAEARAMAKLSHPNVVTIYEVGWSGDQIFLAMEHVQGVTLRHWLGSGATQRSWRDVTKMFVAAGRGLAAAHREGLVHRDFKPDNVLIGSDGRPRVADLGLTTMRTQAAGEVRGDTVRGMEAGGGLPALLTPCVGVGS